jgi:hypothetical protein
MTGIETLIADLGSMGIVGLVAGVLFKKMLDDDKTKMQQRKEEVEYFRAEIAKTREIYQSELKNDRAVYVDSIKQISSRISDIEEDIKDIKKTVVK